VVQRTLPTFELHAKSATFRIADEVEPLEEVSVVSKGKYKGLKLTSLQTVRIHSTGKTNDVEEGAGILYLKDAGRATYKLRGEIRSTERWRERVKGLMTFGSDCTEGLRFLAEAKAAYATFVNSKGESTTKVWIAQGQTRDRKSSQHP
jgi:hypothetical protein